MPGGRELVNWTSKISNPLYIRFRRKFPGDRPPFTLPLGFLLFSLSKDRRCGANRLERSSPDPLWCPLYQFPLSYRASIRTTWIVPKSIYHPRCKRELLPRDRSRNDPTGPLEIRSKRGNTGFERSTLSLALSLSRSPFFFLFFFPCPPEALLINARAAPSSRFMLSKVG